MPEYLEMTIILNTVVNYMLLMGSNRISGFPTAFGRVAAAAALGGLYGGTCLFPGFRFLGNMVWRIVSLALMSLVAFGMDLNALRRGVIFSVLSMALGGIVMRIGSNSVWTVLASAAVLILLCCTGIKKNPGTRIFAPVELQYGGKRLRLTALMDTGNLLRDPVTGSAVLVVDADTAQALTGLSVQQLRSPLDNVGYIPGLRLIPYRAIGQDGGLLLALQVKDVRIGNWKGSSMVAFAPQQLSREGTYQALAGGNL